MITKQDLERWQNAKTLAIKSFATDPEVIIAMQEMYIELKQLRRENMKMLNLEDLLELFAKYTRISREQHYIDSELEELLEEIEDEIDRRNLNLEVA